MLLTDCGSDEVTCPREMGLNCWLDHIRSATGKFSPEQRLAVAAVIVEEMRAAVLSETGFHCSAGIAHNKMLAKLSCGLHKPQQQTIFPQDSVLLLYRELPVHKVRNLGGKLGEEVKEKLGIQTMGELSDISVRQLQRSFGEKTGSWLFEVAHGLDNEPVTARQLPKSIGCGKNFAGKSSLKTKEEVQYWLQQLTAELDERLRRDRSDNKRMAKLLTVSVRCYGDQGSGLTSRSCPIHIYDTKKLAHDALNLLQKINTAPSSSKEWSPALLNITLSAGKFQDDIENGMQNIESFFSTKAKHSPSKQSGSSNEKSISVADTQGIHHERNSEVSVAVNRKPTVSLYSSPNIIKSFLNCQSVKSDFADQYSASNSTVNCDLKDGDRDQRGKVSLKSSPEKTSQELFQQEESPDNPVSDKLLFSSDKDKNKCNITQNKKQEVKKGFFERKLEEISAKKEAKPVNETCCPSVDATLQRSKPNPPQLFNTSYPDLSEGKISLRCSHSPPIGPSSVDLSVLPFLPDSIRKEVEQYLPKEARKYTAQSLANDKVTHLDKYFEKEHETVSISEEVSKEVAESSAQFNLLATTKLEGKASIDYEIRKPETILKNNVEGNLEQWHSKNDVTIEPESISKDEMITVTKCINLSDTYSNKVESSTLKQLSSASSVEPFYKFTNDKKTEDTKDMIEQSLALVKSSSSLAEDLCENCGKCGKNIPIWESQEHQDFHVAEDLQSKFACEVAGSFVSGRPHVCSNPEMLSKTLTKGKKKRRKKEIKTVPLKKPQNMKTMEHYFM
ncbi:uncharacterized protein LOC143229176 [Tachypleus tridentatus]|uniref:uncharacterized protein LOC143229176 n=1 Tax=Tachypleus tridentatus TaxID=6853 RepID=UPI003FD5A95A